MFKVRLAVLGALALFIVSGIAASAASASGPYWHVNGKNLEGTRQIKLQSKGALFLKAPGTLEIECKNSISEGATIEGGAVIQGQAKGRSLYSSCKPIGTLGPKCKVENEQIKTTQIKSYFAKAGQTGIVEVFVPTVGSTFTQFNLINGASPPCTPFKEVGASGTAVAEVVPAGAEGQEGLIGFPSAAILKVEHEGVKEELAALKTVGATSVFSGVYAARLATFPEAFGAFET